MHLTRDEVARERMNAAVELAKKVELLLSPSKEGKKLRNACRAEAERKEVPRNRQDKADASAVVCFAFLKFVHREERLPSKKELNVEANRLAKCEVGGIGERQFGEAVQRDGIKWLVYDSISKIEFNSDHDMNMGWEYRIVPFLRWDEPKWEKSSGAAEYTTPLGLKGLPEAHEDKGKKDRKKT